MRVFIASLFFSVFLINLCAQQQGNISGFIYNQSSGEALTNVSVVIKELGTGAATNERGFFSINDVPYGSWTLSISHVGFMPFSQKVLINSEVNERAFYLYPQPTELDEFVVKEIQAVNQLNNKVPYIENVFGTAKLRQSAVRDVGEFLRSSTNINGIRKGGTQLDPVIRGFKYSQLNVQLNDGQKIEGGCPNRMDPATAHIEPEDLESIEVVKGPYALRYGPSFGGIINMKTNRMKPADNPFIRVNALQSFESNWNGEKQYASIAAGNRLGYLVLSGSLKNYGNYKDGNGNEVNSQFRKYNYTAQLGIQPAKNHSLLFAFDESKGRDVRFPALPMDERIDDTRLLSADYHYKKDDGLLEFVNLKLYNSSVHHEMDNKYRPFSDTVVAVSVIDAINRGFRVEGGFRIYNGTLITGIDFENIQKDGQRDKSMITQVPLVVKKEKLWNNAAISNTGLFAGYSLSFVKLEIMVSMRVDFNGAKSDSLFLLKKPGEVLFNYNGDSTKSSFTNFSFSGGVTRKLSDKWSVSLSLGRGVRSPDMTERFIILLPIGYDQFDYLGNPELKPEVNNQADFTIKFNDKQWGSFMVNGFYSRVENYITGKRLPFSVQKPLSADVLGVKEFYNAGKARLSGFEMMYNSPSGNKLGISLSAAYTSGTLDKATMFITNASGEVIDDEILINDALTEIPPFESTLSFYYRMFRDKFFPQVTARFVAAQQHVSAASYESVTPGFVVAGVSLKYYVNNFLSLSGGVNNLFNQAYYEHLNRNIIGTDNNLYEPGRSFYINIYFNF